MITLELIAFIGSVLFGILLYWRESSSNRLYRFFNKLMYSRELQMKVTDRTGFVYEQRLVLRFIFITVIYLILLLVFRFLLPIDLGTVSIFASGIVGAVIGSYLASFIFKSSTIIDEQSDSISDALKDTFDKGKELLADVKDKVEGIDKELLEANSKSESAEVPTEKTQTVQPEKSARERLKDKGLL
ncbi:hypothetical protein MWU59_08340 [Flavobacteriaceae bacterium F08102]|nr:hypothetical protein [Flavobacteriaceae bacterium F08102]